MADVYMYVDETGDLDLTGNANSSRYFGIGSATLTGEHGAALWSGKQLRFQQEEAGIARPKGFHAKDDTPRTRHEVFAVVASIAPRFDFTLLDKTKMYPYVRARGEVPFYRLAWYLHFKAIAPRVASVGDRLFVAAGTLGTSGRVKQARTALDEVCRQVAGDRTVVLAQWKAETSFGIQLADYGLWATQRGFERSDWTWYTRYVSPSVSTCYDVWN